MDPEFDELKREFLAEARQKVEEIGSSFRSSGQEGLSRLINLAHQLKGAGGSYGFQAISTESAALEASLEKIASGASPDAEEDVAERLRRLQAELSKRIAELTTIPAV